MASSHAVREQQLLEKTDSVAVADSSNVEQLEIHEEEEVAPAPSARRSRWYIYIIGLVAALLAGVALGIKAGRASK